MTRLHSSGVLRYAENDSDLDAPMKFTFTSKGPNALGNKSDRRISVRQRILHPSAVSIIDLASCSASDPGRGGYLSPYTDMKSMYFDDSLYENHMHYHISELLDQMDADDDIEELVIKCDNEEEYNKTLDDLYHYGDGKFKFSGITGDPMKIIVEKDVREKYRVFDEEAFLMKKEETK